MYRFLKRKQKGDGRHLKPTGKQKVRAPVTHRAVQRETRTIPIVFAAASDPVGSGIVAQLDRPSENITGFGTNESSLGGKWLELLSEIAPGLKRTQVRDGRKPQNRQGARSCGTPIDFASRRRGDRISAAKLSRHSSG